jgi:glutathione S-transferase
MGSNRPPSKLAEYAAQNARKRQTHETALTKQAQVLASKFMQMEQVMSDQGPYFSGSSFCIVDAAFAPIYRYFDVFERTANFDVFEKLPKIRAWREALAQRESVKNAVRNDYPELLEEFLVQRPSALSRLMTQR